MPIFQFVVRNENANRYNTKIKLYFETNFATNIKNL